MNDGIDENKPQSSTEKAEVDNEPKENKLQNSTSFTDGDKQSSLKGSVGSTQSSSRESYDQNDTEFDFFYKLNKKMILKRLDIGDVSTFSYWLKVLDQVQDKQIRNDYIKLMTLALQHPEPMCPFNEPPPEKIDPLQYGVIEMARKYRKGDGDATCIGKNEMETETSYPSTSTAVSHDKRRYASCQIIPNVGVQCYYAFSDDHLFNWTLPPQVTIPKDGVHARDMEWERAFAGILPTSIKPGPENLDKNKTRNDKSDKEDDSTSKSLAGSGLTKKNTDKYVEKGKSPLCNVMYIEQQNRNFTEEFRWNDASLLTRAMILGAEAITDCKIDTQNKTQLAIDEEATSVHDKVYPGDFRIQVNPSILDDIGMIQKCAEMESDTVKDPDENNAKPQSNDPGGNNGKTFTNPINNYGNRQRAGQDNVSYTEDSRSGGAKNDEDYRNCKPSGSSADRISSGSSTNSKRIRCPKPIHSSREDDVPARHTKNAKVFGRRPDDTNLLFEKASLELKRQVNITKKCFDDVRSLIKNNRNKETRKRGQHVQSFSDSDQLSDM